MATTFASRVENRNLAASRRRWYAVADPVQSFFREYGDRCPCDFARIHSSRSPPVAPSAPPLQERERAPATAACPSRGRTTAKHARYPVARASPRPSSSLVIGPRRRHLRKFGFFRGERSNPAPRPPPPVRARTY